MFVAHILPEKKETGLKSRTEEKQTLRWDTSGGEKNKSTARNKGTENNSEGK